MKSHSGQNASTHHGSDILTMLYWPLVLGGNPKVVVVPLARSKTDRRRPHATRTVATTKTKNAT